MRKATSLSVNVVIAFVITQILISVLKAAETDLLWWQHLGLFFAACLVSGSVIGFILDRFNASLLRWRKVRGRDIEGEERYESADGMISLIPKDKENEATS
jgi:hypothetical protein